MQQVQSLIEKSGFDTSILTTLVPQQEVDATVKPGKKYTDSINLLKGLIRWQQRKKQLKPKYRDPITCATHSGRGKKSLWMIEHENNGGSLEDLLIDKD